MHVAGHGFAHNRHRLPHASVTCERAVYLAKLDAKSPDLHLFVAASEELYAVAGQMTLRDHLPHT